MPADLNRVTLVGRLTRDPELRHTAGGDPICSIRLAVSSRGRDEQGNWTDKPNYFDVSVWGRQAETAGQYLAKGRRIGVDGSLAWREWTAQDGGKRQSVEVRARDIYFLDSRGDGDGGGSGGGGNAGWSQPQGGDLPVDTSDSTPQAQPAGGGDDDIPF